MQIENNGLNDSFRESNINQSEIVNQNAYDNEQISDILARPDERRLQNRDQ